MEPPRLFELEMNMRVKIDPFETFLTQFVNTRIELDVLSEVVFVSFVFFQQFEEFTSVLLVLVPVVCRLQNELWDEITAEAEAGN